MSFESRNVYVGTHRTSIRLEPEMWIALKEVSSIENCSIHNICTLVNLKKPPHYSLAAAVRVYLMLYYRAATTTEGHKKAGHGAIAQTELNAAHRAELLQEKERYLKTKTV